MWRFGKSENVLRGVLDGERARLFLVFGALSGATLSVWGAGRVVFDWVTNAKAKEAKALLAWRKSKIEAMQANTAELKAIKEALKMPKESAKEPAKETFFRVCDT